MSYVELHCHSAYSFLDGASHPEELAARAAELGYEALALTDHDGVYGSLEFAHAAKHLGVRPITGAEVTLTGGAHVTLLCESQTGYANLCRILTAAHADTRRPGREDREPLPPAVALETVVGHAAGLVCLSGCAREGLGTRDPNTAARLAQAFGRDRFYVELQRPFVRGDARRNAALLDLAEHLGVETVATGDVHAHNGRRAVLQDVLVAVRCRTSLDGCEPQRRGNRESVLRAPAEMVDRFAGLDRAAAERSVRLAERLEFDLTQELGYRYPDFSDGDVPAIAQLAQVCEDAFAERYPPSNRPLLNQARARLETELRL
ncbi:MAG TPA: PHP domain-containing protein, partial [Gaiellaceae bacterium]|nr:PHP domain-containing protein [Gaiellaceae bacterium]